MLPQPAACSSAIWPAKSWSRVDTRAYPKVAIFTPAFEIDIRINKPSENGRQEFYAQLLSFERIIGRSEATPPPVVPGRRAGSTHLTSGLSFSAMCEGDHVSPCSPRL